MTAALCHPEMTNNFVKFPPVISNISGMKWLSVIVSDAAARDEVLIFFPKPVWEIKWDLRFAQRRCCKRTANSD